MLSRVELADLLSVVPRSVDRFAEEGMPIARRGKGRRGHGFQAKACVAWYLEREKAALMGSGDEVSPQKARALLDIRRREELELKLKVRRGELVPIEETARDFAEVAAAVKARLRRIPTAVADRLIGMTTPHEIHGLLLREIDAALGELAAKADALEPSAA